MTAQLITPNPNIPCKPGWCLQYVRQTYGLAGVYPTATAGWEASPTQHRDRDFPAGCWVPVWFSLVGEPAGHVALLAPDGSVYSTSDLGNVPHHHPNLDDLIGYYAYYGLSLTYLGWTEDIEDVAVVAGSLAYAGGTITPEEDDMPYTPEQIKGWVAEAIQPMHDVTRQYLADRTKDGTLAVLNGTQAQEDVTRLYLADQTQAQQDVTRQYLADRIKEASPAEIADLVPATIAQEVIDALSERLAGGK